MQIERGGSPRPIDDFITDSPDGLNWVKIGDAPAQGNYITKTAEKIKPEGLSKTREVHPGDLILSNSMSFGKPYIMGIDGCIHDGWLLIRNTYKVFDLTFLCHLLGTPQMIIQYKSLAAGSTVNNLNKELVGNTVVTIPTIKEQRVLGQYLETLDNLITLHQRKYDKLTNVKKSMLGKMFPQNGSNVPEIRFKGFTEAWEQRKFDEVFDCTIPNNTLSRAELNYESGSVRNIHYGDILIKYGSVVDVQNDEIPFATGKSSDDFKGALLRDGDIIIADTAEDETTGKACEIGNSQGLDVVSGLHTMVCRPRNKMALGYLGYYLNSDAYHHQLLPLMQGIKVLSLSRTNVQKTMVCYPKSKAEQQLIADCFRNLDNLITLHQREFVFLCKEKIEIIRYIKNTWEQRKVGDLLIERNQQAPMSDEYPLMAFIANEGVAPKGDRYDRSALVTDTANKLYKKTEIGDFIYSSNNLETGSIGLNKYGKACISPVYSIFEPTGIADSDFLGRRLVRKDFINAMVKWRQGVIYGQWRIHESDFLKIEIPVPSVVEQRKIGAYLDQLDRLITLHQRKPNFYTGGYYAE